MKNDWKFKILKFIANLLGIPENKNTYLVPNIEYSKFKIERVISEIKIQPDEIKCLPTSYLKNKLHQNLIEEISKNPKSINYIEHKYDLISNTYTYAAELYYCVKKN
jgi:hypothetical protein